MKGYFNSFTANDIVPTGWVKDQLIIQANGLSGNLDKMWPDVKDSKWIGGDREGWERVPYWLDGFIPLAYLLRDEDMINRAKKYVNAIIERQKPDGFLCPCEDDKRSSYDMWALFIISKALIEYYLCENDERIIDVIYKAYKNFYKQNSWQLTFNWASSRWFEGVLSLVWLYEKRPEHWIIELAETLEAQGLDYLKAKEYLKQKATETNPQWTYVHHVVNLAMALKTDAVMHTFDGRNPNAYAEKLLKILLKYHGNVNDYFNGDECLSGTSPIRGTELCGVVEAMFSYEILARVSGKIKWMDYLEKLCFNSLPATLSEDMWTHQYNQMTNQPYSVYYSKYKDIPSHFSTNCSASHLFGLEPNYGCCTANFNQGFPKFAISIFAKKEDGIGIMSLAPSKLVTKKDGVGLSIENVGLYPFRDNVKIKVKADKKIKLKLYIRIPEFCESAFVNNVSAKVGEFFVLEKEFFNDEITVTLKTEPKFVKRNTLYAVKKGALTYALQLDYKKESFEYLDGNNVNHVFPYCDYELTPTSEWQYAFYDTKLEYGESDDYSSAFSESKPLSYIKVNLVKINWGHLKGNDLMPRETPKSRKPIGKPVTVKLVPYGIAKLRMTELPLINK